MERDESTTRSRTTLEARRRSIAPSASSREEGAHADAQRASSAVHSHARFDVARATATRFARCAKSLYPLVVMRAKQIIVAAGLALTCAAAVAGAARCAKRAPSAPESAAPSDAHDAASARSVRGLTFTEDVAPLVYTKCAPCHRPEGAGPFDLLTYRDVADHAPQIREVTQSHFMPPWKAVSEPGSVAFSNDRGLDDAQIALLGAWVAAGAPEGDRAKRPPPPTWPRGWQLGEPSLLVKLPEPYPLQSEGTDVYRNFVIPSPVHEARYVAAWEFHADSRVIHHAILNVDRYGLARKRDEHDPGPGFFSMDVGEVESPDGFYLVWTPGKAPIPPTPGVAWRLEPNVDLVLQVHMQPSGKRETIQPTIAFYFTDEPPTSRRYTLRVGDPPIDIPPGERAYRVHDEYVLPAPVRVLSLFPHAHHLATHVRLTATPPDDGAPLTLLRIDDWDFNWQDEYVLAEPAVLPKDTRLSFEATYDNSDANPRNPSHPPKRVRFGEKSTDEMGNITMQVEPLGPHGFDYLREARARRMLASDPSARNYYNLANALSDLGDKDQAIANYRKAIEQNPDLPPAHFNLANLLLERDDNDGAIAEYKRAIAVKPVYARAYLNMGVAYEKKGDRERAVVQYRRALEIEPTLTQASAGLERALASRDR
jgi:hypothetical protein